MPLLKVLERMNATVVRLGSCFAAIVLVASDAGCSTGQRDKGEVRGRVTLDGEPLKLGSITLEPVGGSRGELTGCLVQDGRYELTGRAAARVGAYRVAVNASPTPTGRMIQDPSKPPGSLSPEMLGGVVAERFNAATTLRLEVVAGENVADFHVESK